MEFGKQPIMTHINDLGYVTLQFLCFIKFIQTKKAYIIYSLKENIVSMVKKVRKVCLELKACETSKKALGIFPHTNVRGRKYSSIFKCRGGDEFSISRCRGARIFGTQLKSRDSKLNKIITQYGWWSHVLTGLVNLRTNSNVCNFRTQSTACIFRTDCCFALCVPQHQFQPFITYRYHI